MKLLALFGVFLLVALVHQTAAASCHIYCLAVYRPVCGKMKQEDGTWKYKTFSNQCVLDVENKCHGGKYVPCP